jgi:hypothetical protein
MSCNLFNVVGGLCASLWWNSLAKMSRNTFLNCVIYSTKVYVNHHLVLLSCSSFKGVDIGKVASVH